MKEKDSITVQEAREGLAFIGIWMDARYNSRFVETPIQEWDMPRKEKGFFTVYAMNLVLESDGFDCLAGQEPVDVEAFIALLHRLGAKKTSIFVHKTLVVLKTKTRRERNTCTSEYYDLFKREKVWLKLLDYLGQRIYMNYLLRAQAIDASGENLFDPKQWRGEFSKS